MINLFRKKLDINLSDLNYLSFRENNNPSYIKENYTDSFSSLLVNIAKVILRSIYGLFYFKKHSSKKELDVDFLFYYITANNKRSLEPVQELLPKSIIFGPKDMNSRSSWKYGILYIGKVFRQFRNENDEYLRKVYISEFVSLCLTYCYYHNAIRNIESIRPKYLILANDHLAHARSYLRVAQDMGIKTVYLQHASISDKFPPLEFDYAFLDGKESYDKYLKIGTCASSVFLLGNPRFDLIPQIIKTELRPEIRKLGISINLIDNWDKVYSLIQSISDCDNIKLDITLRPHPSMDMDKVDDYFRKLRIRISDPVKENPFFFIENNDIFISCESSIHLDTVLADKVSLYYRFTKGSDTFDVYGYLKNNLIKDISESPVDCLLEILIDIDNYRDKNTSAKQYYVANYGCDSWGYSSKSIADVLNKLNNEKQ